MIYTFFAVTTAFFVPVAVKFGAPMKYFKTVSIGGES
jgi:hypothetical protein